MSWKIFSIGKCPVVRSENRRNWHLQASFSSWLNHPMKLNLKHLWCKKGPNMSLKNHGKWRHESTFRGKRRDSSQISNFFSIMENLQGWKVKIAEHDPFGRLLKINRMIPWCRLWKFWRPVKVQAWIWRIVENDTGRAFFDKTWRFQADSEGNIFYRKMSWDENWTSLKMTTSGHIS